MVWIVVSGFIGFGLGLAVGIVWVNVSINNAIGRHFGW